MPKLSEAERRRVSTYDAGNMEAAEVIAADPEKYGPGLAEFAEKALARLAKKDDCGTPDDDQIRP